MAEKKKETVLIVHNYYQIPGGEDTVVANEKKMLEDHGHKVVLYTRHNNEIKNLSLWGKVLLPFRTIFNWQTYKDVRRIIREENIDIVHVHNTLPLISFAVYYAAISLNKPVVQTVHNFRLLCPAATFYREGHICEDCVNKGLLNAVKYSCYRNSRLQTIICVINMLIHRWTRVYKKISYICLTDFNRNKLLEHKLISEEQVFIKSNYVSAEGDITPYLARNKQFMFVGRLDKLKGVDILLDAWRIMGENAPELLMFGDGPLRDTCKKEIAAGNLNIRFMGYVSNSEVRKQLASSMALVFPSQWYEGFPMSIVEAFSVGTPVICSNLGNSVSLVDNGINGYKFTFTSADDLAIIVKKSEKQNICESTYSIYKKLYTEEKNYVTLMSIYDNVQLSANTIYGKR